MKILICYHTITGNTEKVAKSMKEGLAEENVTLIPANDVDSASLASYDVVFLGSGTYAASVGKSVRKLIKNAEALPSKFVLFYTHASPGPNKCFYRVEKQIARKNSSILEKFECLGATKPNKEQLDAMTPEQREAYNKLSGHPNETDLENAKKFAKSVIGNLK
ncbi:MAG: flavodoxin domain-containing protein [Candidatus Helarchaeota archaeon]|nr:flavodoxin domain-containing protein [Candidatus Helarchaeota archaeon]